jgi:hypothetical protein
MVVLGLKAGLHPSGKPADRAVRLLSCFEKGSFSGADLPIKKDFSWEAGLNALLLIKLVIRV